MSQAGGLDESGRWSRGVRQVASRSQAGGLEESGRWLFHLLVVLKTVSQQTDE